MTGIALGRTGESQSEKDVYERDATLVKATSVMVLLPRDWTSFEGQADE